MRPYFEKENIEVKLRNLFLVLMALLCLPVIAISQDKMAPKTTAKKTATAKKLQPRDPKTGRFMKKADADKMTAKKGPARDPKTGRFVKKDAAATKTTTAKKDAKKK